MQLINTLDSHLELEHDGVQLFRYVYNPQTPPIESPRPYFHPLRTLKGKVVSGFRPHDHRWHHGLSFTCAHLSGHNFWGGPTYVRGEGYRQLENNGWQEADGLYIQGFSEPEQQEIHHDVVWNAGAEQLFGERRSIISTTGEDFWQLALNFHLDNADNMSQKPLIWGCPTTQGRDNAGYGGLFWRGPRDFLGGKILMSEGRVGPDLMGQKSPWLAYIGQHDESDDYSTLVFIEDPKNNPRYPTHPRYPTQWFVRNTTPMVCPNFFFDEEYVQQECEILSLNYKILIADGAWSRERIEAEVEKQGN